MEEEGIGLVLARATELRFRISNCIHRATDPAAPLEDDKKHEDEGDYHEADYGEEAERLLNICDALEALESQLSSLQAMQQNHKYEREEALAEIEYSRKMLLDKLKEYKGEELEVIQEASAFAGDTVEHNTDLLLPPYPSRPPLHLSSFSSPRKSIRNGMISSDLSSELKKNVDELEKNQSRSRLRNQGARLGQLFGAAAKSVVTLVGVLSLLSLAGLGSGRKSNGPFKDLGMILGSIGRRSEQGVRCPSGKVLVMEDGQPRCLVKERVEVPFESVVATPDVNYGCG